MATFVAKNGGGVKKKPMKNKRHLYFQPFLLNQKQKWYTFKTYDIIHPCQMQ